MKKAPISNQSFGYFQVKKMLRYSWHTFQSRTETEHKKKQTNEKKLLDKRNETKVICKPFAIKKEIVNSWNGRDEFNRRYLVKNVLSLIVVSYQ